MSYSSGIALQGATTVLHDMLDTNHKILVARELSRVMVGMRWLLGRPSTLLARRRGAWWSLDLREGIDLSIYLLGGFEVRTLAQYARLLRPGDIVLDIGANIGAHTIPLAMLVGATGRVISFEPTAWAFRKQLANIALNPEIAARINPHQMLLVGSSESALPEAICSSWPMERAADLDQQHGGRRMSTSGAICMKLDDLLEREGIQRINLVKLDVDGNELDVLRGASRMLHVLRPPIILELAPFVHKHEPTRFDDLIGMLKSASYRLEEMTTHRSLPMDPCALRSRIPQGGGINALALAT